MSLQHARIDDLQTALATAPDLNSSSVKAVVEEILRRFPTETVHPDKIPADLTRVFSLSDAQKEAIQKQVMENLFGGQENTEGKPIMAFFGGPIASGKSTHIKMTNRVMAEVMQEYDRLSNGSNSMGRYASAMSQIKRKYNKYGIDVTVRGVEEFKRTLQAFIDRDVLRTMHPYFDILSSCYPDCIARLTDDALKMRYNILEYAMRSGKFVSTEQTYGNDDVLSIIEKAKSNQMPDGTPKKPHELHLVVVATPKCVAVTRSISRYLKEIDEYAANPKGNLPARYESFKNISDRHDNIRGVTNKIHDMMSGNDVFVLFDMIHNPIAVFSATSKERVGDRFQHVVDSEIPAQELYFNQALAAENLERAKMLCPDNVDCIQAATWASENLNKQVKQFEIQPQTTKQKIEQARVGAVEEAKKFAESLIPRLGGR